MRTQRQLRVGEEIRHALAAVLQRGDVPWAGDFRPEFITVTEVQVSPDLKNASVFVMPLGGQNMPATIKALNGIVGFFRHELSQAVKMRYVPKLLFKPDNSFDYAHRIDTILHDPSVAKDLTRDE